MSRLSKHLPQLGGLVLAALVAAVAYSVYEEQSTTSNTSRPAPASGRLADLVVPPLSDGGSQSRGEDAVKVAHRTSPDTGSATAGAAAAPALAGEDIDAAADAEEPVAVPASDILTPSPIADRRDDQPGSPGGDGHGNGLDGRSVDRELQRLIGDGPRNEGLGNGKASKGLDERSIDRELQRLGRNAPVTPAPGLPDTEDDVPVDAPAPAAQTPGAPPAPTAPAPPPPAVADPATPADPDAVLDDTPAGELDQTDLGGQVDEADPAGAAPAAAPAAPAPAPALPAPEPAAPAPAPTEVAPATAPVDAPAPAQAAPA